MPALFSLYKTAQRLSRSKDVSRSHPEEDNLETVLDMRPGESDILRWRLLQYLNYDDPTHVFSFQGKFDGASPPRDEDLRDSRIPA